MGTAVFWFIFSLLRWTNCNGIWRSTSELTLVIPKEHQARLWGFTFPVWRVLPEGDLVSLTRFDTKKNSTNSEEAVYHRTGFQSLLMKHRKSIAQAVHWRIYSATAFANSKNWLHLHTFTNRKVLSTFSRHWSLKLFTVAFYFTSGTQGWC